MKKLRYLGLNCLLLCVLTGCWDAKEIQTINYATAIGVDYKDNQYLAYLQLIDFNNVAKTEGGVPSEAQVWVGKGRGLTVNEAINDIYRSSQQLVSWGNVTAIVFSEGVIKKGISEILDLTNRYREIRYTKWVFGTHDSIEEVFSVTPFFNKSPLASILHEPMDAYKQASNIKPLKMNAFIAKFHEPQITLLPSLAIAKDTWIENDKKHEMLEINGSFLMESEHHNGWLAQTNLMGIWWMEQDSYRIPVTIMLGNKPIMTLIATHPKHSIDWDVHHNKLKFHLTITVKMSVNELLQSIEVSEIEKQAAEVIEKQIRKTYDEGLRLRSDILNLGHVLYMKKPRVWHQFWDDGRFPLDESSLASVDVQVSLQNSGKYKLKE